MFKELNENYNKNESTDSKSGHKNYKTELNVNWIKEIRQLKLKVS